MVTKQGRIYDYRRPPKSYRQHGLNVSTFYRKRRTASKLWKPGGPWAGNPSLCYFLQLQGYRTHLAQPSLPHWLSIIALMQQCQELYPLMDYRPQEMSVVSLCQRLHDYGVSHRSYIKPWGWGCRNIVRYVDILKLSFHFLGYSGMRHEFCG